MAITINNGPLTVAVKAILGWSTTRASANIVHTVIGRRDRDVTLGELGLREGTMTVLTDTLGDAAAVEAYFATKGVHHLVDDERPEVEMRFVLNGTVGVTLDDETATAATVELGFQEVAA